MSSYQLSIKLGVVAFLVTSLAWSSGIPDCPAYGRPLPVNNGQVLHWKRTTDNQFRERANVEGKVVRVFPDRNGHEHFEIQIGKYAEDVIEVIYNQDFGAMPEPQIGMNAQACGDYITSTAPSGPYPASPSGAIIHWVHMNPRGRGHDPGFLILDGVLYGQDIENAGPRKRHPPKRKKPHYYENSSWSPSAVTLQR